MGSLGPKVTYESTEISLKDCNFVQEQLALIGIEYALLSYTPANPRSVIVAVNGLCLIQGVDYQIDGRKVQFDPQLQAQNDIVMAMYPTASTVADIPAVTIEFDIPGQNVRIGSSGSMQIMVDAVWYDMIPQEDPITGSISLVADDNPSLNQ